MSAASGGTTRIWIWAAGGAVVAAALVVLLFGTARPPGPPPAPARPRPAIELTARASKSALDDEATLFDPTPLFLPTKWNAAQKDFVPPEPGGTFQSYPAKPEFAETNLKLGRTEPADSPGKPAAAPKLWTSIDLPDPVAVPQKPAEVLATDTPGSLSLGFGRADTPVAARPARGAFVEIVIAGTGVRALPEQAMAQVQALAAAARPPGGREWQTMEFVVAVDPAGLAAPLMMTARSGVEEIDGYFQKFLVQTLRVGERLKPGFYRISVGP